MLFSKQLVVILLFIAVNIIANSNLKVSGSLGYGNLSGNIPDISVFSFAGAVQFPSVVFADTDIKAEVMWAKTYKYFFPSGTIKHHSYIASLAISGVIKQQLDENLFLEESAGYLLLYDKTYEFESSYNSGINFCAAIGINTDKKNPQSNSLLLGFNYGLTFTNNNTSFFVTYLQYKISL